jgi:hypothetical protein
MFVGKGNHYLAWLKAQDAVVVLGVALEVVYDEADLENSLVGEGIGEHGLLLWRYRRWQRGRVKASSLTLQICFYG